MDEGGGGPDAQVIIINPLTFRQPGRAVAVGQPTTAASVHPFLKRSTSSFIVFSSDQQPEVAAVPAIVRSLV